MSAALAGVTIGVEVFYRNVNEAHGRARWTDEPYIPTLVTIVKVGPKRVQYESYGRPAYANIETGRIDDWSFLQTQAAWHEANARSELAKALLEHKVKLEHGNHVSLARLAALLAVMETAESDLPGSSAIGV
jgi:hypothetical protein